MVLLLIPIQVMVVELEAVILALTVAMEDKVVVDQLFVIAVLM